MCVFLFFPSALVCDETYACNLFPSYGALLCRLNLPYQVSRDLPEKQQQIEGLLKDLSQFQLELSQLSQWAAGFKDQLELSRQAAGPGGVDVKVLVLPVPPISTPTSSPSTYTPICVPFSALIL